MSAASAQGSTGQPAILQASGLAVSATLGGQRVNVLQDLTFSLAPGRVLGLVGESGAGKSMLGRTISQMLPAGFAVSAGTLSFAGRSLVDMAPGARRALLGRDLAFIPQEPLSALNPVLTIGRQMDEHLARIDPMAGRAERRSRALAAFEAVRLAHGAELLGRYPHQLSGGMCQRVLIAMAFASRPKLVVADEPTTALDVTIQARVVGLLRAMQERDGTAVVFVTHDLRLAAQICDDIMVLYAGRPAELGPAKLFRAPAHPYTRCLQLAAPAMTGPPRGLYALPERMPSLRSFNALAGECRFAPRCPHAIPACREGEPPFVDVGSGHVASCIRTAETGSILPPPAPAPVPIGHGAPLLDLRSVTRRFAAPGRFWKPGASFTAVSNASLTLREGEFLGIVGESGSGKSTLARMVVGLDRPSDGRIILGGRDMTTDTVALRAYRRGIVQMVFQDPQSALNPRRRVGSLVTQALETGGFSASERRRRADIALADVALAPEMALRFPAQLSGGQKQRVNIARALAAEPRLLVADEIVSGLDVSVQAQIIDLLMRLRRERGFSMLFIAHDLSVVRQLCDRVVVMYRGEIVETGPTERVFAEPAHAYTRTLLSAVPPDDPAESWAGGVAA